MTYSIDSDVRAKFANVTIPSGLLVPGFRTSAYNRINSKLRKLYVVPIASSDDTDMGVLKEIEANLSAGKILMAVGTLNEVDTVHEYGRELVKAGEFEIKELVDEKMVLSISSARDTDDSDEIIDPPLILGNSSDEHATFDRPMSGIENDAIEGKVDAEEYNELEDNKTV